MRIAENQGISQEKLQGAREIGYFARKFAECQGNWVFSKKKCRVPEKLGISQENLQSARNAQRTTPPSRSKKLVT